MSVPDQNIISNYVKSHPEATSLDIWAQFEALRESREAVAKTFKEKQELKLFLKDIVIQYTYPRLDINVSKQMNHLLKAPFVVHPKTGRVCVPIDPTKLDQFNPLEVPTVGRFVEELGSSGDSRQTSLSPYMTFFETQFLQPLERESIGQLQQGPAALQW